MSSPPAASPAGTVTTPPKPEPRPEPCRRTWVTLHTTPPGRRTTVDPWTPPATPPPACIACSPPSARTFPHRPSANTRSPRPCLHRRRPTHPCCTRAPPAQQHGRSMDTPSPDTSRLHGLFTALREDLSTQIVGQSALVERLLIALLADGHLLVEGAPGHAKTTAIRALASRVDADFARVQFTPDLPPADLTGTEVWRPQDGRFEFQPGPIFHSVLLADEINRAPAKVQSALLEAMGERQVTVGRQTYALPSLFLVMATQDRKSTRLNSSH